jgi:hypothetical protein
VVVSPLAFTVPFRVVSVNPIADAAPVVAVGGVWPITGKPNAIRNIIKIPGKNNRLFLKLFILNSFGYIFVQNAKPLNSF